MKDLVFVLKNKKWLATGAGHWCCTWHRRRGRRCTMLVGGTSASYCCSSTKVSKTAGCWASRTPNRWMVARSKRSVLVGSGHRSNPHRSLNFVSKDKSQFNSIQVNFMESIYCECWGIFFFVWKEILKRKAKVRQRPPFESPLIFSSFKKYLNN